MTLKMYVMSIAMCYDHIQGYYKTSEVLSEVTERHWMYAVSCNLKTSVSTSSLVGALMIIAQLCPNTHVNINLLKPSG